MKTKPNDTRFPNEGRFAYDGLDRVIHERARLSVLTSLITHPKGLSFVELKKLCTLTDGNLARHLQVLEEEGLVRIDKNQESARTQTITRITATGRKRYLEYLNTLEQVIKDAAKAAKQQASPETPHLKPIKT